MTQDVSKNGNAVSTDHMPLPSARDMDVRLDALIVDDAFNARTNLDGGVGDEHTKVSHVQDSMQSAGQITPILVETRRMGQGKNATEKYYLISGFRRVTAARKLGWDTIKARAFEPMSEKQRIYLNLMENTAREDLSAYDTAMACSKLIQLGDTSQEVGLRLGKSDSYIRALNGNVRGLIPMILQRWKVESSSSFGGKAKVCSTDWLAKVSKLTLADGSPDVAQQEVEYYSKLSSKDPKAHAEVKGTSGEAGTGNAGTDQPKAEIVKRPSKIAIENAIKAMLAKTNAGLGNKESMAIAMEALRWSLGIRDKIVDGVVCLYDPGVDKLSE